VNRSEFFFQVANDIPNLEAVRFNLKTPFDRNIVTQFEHEEVLLDYGFHHLGLDDQAIGHPIVMSEAPANAASSRACKYQTLEDLLSLIEDHDLLSNFA
jgi:actin-related protein 5